MSIYTPISVAILLSKQTIHFALVTQFSSNQINFPYFQGNGHTFFLIEFEHYHSK